MGASQLLQIMVQLPNSKVDTKLIIFPFHQMLCSLLTDPKAMQPDNPLIDWDRPFQNPGDRVPLGETKVYADVDTGDVFIQAWTRLCVKGRDILCPIIIFGDKNPRGHQRKANGGAPPLYSGHFQMQLPQQCPGLAAPWICSRPRQNSSKPRQR